MKTNVNTWLQKLFIISAGFIFTPIFSQVDFSSTRFGLIAGPTYSRIQNAHNPSSSRISFYGGALAIIPIGGDDEAECAAVGGRAADPVRAQIDLCGSHGGSSFTLSTCYARCSCQAWWLAQPIKAVSTLTIAGEGSRLRIVVRRNIYSDVRN